MMCMNSYHPVSLEAAWIERVNYGQGSSLQAQSGKRSGASAHRDKHLVNVDIARKEDVDEGQGDSKTWAGGDDARPRGHHDQHAQSYACQDFHSEKRYCTPSAAGWGIGVRFHGGSGRSWAPIPAAVAAIVRVTIWRAGFSLRCPDTAALSKRKARSWHAGMSQAEPLEVHAVEGCRLAEGAGQPMACRGDPVQYCCGVLHSFMESIGCGPGRPSCTRSPELLLLEGGCS